jgi:hypothetical protein
MAHAPPIDSLIPAYQAMADTENFHGLSILQHADSIGKMVRMARAKTLLDFGCGRGDAYRSPHHVWKQWGLPFSGVTMYDPAFSRNNELPAAGKKFDVVVCSDVLEHIPEDEVDAFIERLAAYTRHALWASVCCRPAKKTFPDGTNLHITVKPYSWWREKVEAAAARHNVAFTLVETP